MSVKARKFRDSLASPSPSSHPAWLCDLTLEFLPSHTPLHCFCNSCNPCHNFFLWKGTFWDVKITSRQVPLSLKLVNGIGSPPLFNLYSLILSYFSLVSGVIPTSPMWPLYPMSPWLIERLVRGEVCDLSQWESEKFAPAAWLSTTAPWDLSTLFPQRAFYDHVSQRSFV